MGLDTLLKNQLCHWQKFRRCTCTFPSGSKLSLFFYGQRFLRYRSIFKITIFWHATCHWQKFQKWHIHSLSTQIPKGSNLSWFSLNRQWFPRYRQIFKIAIFGHETWPFAKVPEVAHNTPFLPQEVDIELIFALHTIKETAITITKINRVLILVLIGLCHPGTLHLHADLTTTHSI